MEQPNKQRGVVGGSGDPDQAAVSQAPHSKEKSSRTIAGLVDGIAEGRAIEGLMRKRKGKR